MARLWQSGFELNSTTADMEFSTTSGTASIQTGTVRTGTYAARTNPAATTGFFRYHVFASNQSTVAYQRAYLRIATLPGANTTIMRFADAANNACAQIRITSTGTLILLDAGSTPVGSASVALNTGQWYRIELKLDASSSPGSLDARVDGTSFASGANNAQSPWARVLVGPVVSATCDLFWDDWALNDNSGSAQTSWPGAGQIIHLVPNGDGDNHGWNNTANGAGSSTNWQLVDEVPPNDTTDLVQTGTLNTEDMYTMSDSAIGASDTVNCVMVGLRLRNNTADATTAAKAQIKKTTGGTIGQGTASIPNSTTFSTNGTSQPHNYTLITYTDPDGSAWTQSTLDSMQAGVKLTAAGTNRIQVTAVWAAVDYTPSSSTDATVTPSAVAAVTAVPSAAKSTGSTIAPATAAATTSTPSVSVSTGNTASPAATAATVAVSAPALSAGSTVTPVAVAAITATPAPAIRTGSTVSTSAVSAMTAVPAPTVSAGGNASVIPASVVTVVAIPATSVSNGSRAAPATVAAIAGVPAPVVVLGVHITPAAAAASAAFPAPSIALTATVTAAPLTCAATIPAPVVVMTGAAGSMRHRARITSAAAEHDRTGQVMAGRPRTGTVMQ